MITEAGYTAACSCSASTSSAVQSTAVPHGLISCPNLSCSTWTKSAVVVQLFQVNWKTTAERAAAQYWQNRLLQWNFLQVKEVSCFYLPCCRNPSGSADRLAATILKQDFGYWVMEALVVMIDWRIFSSFFAFLHSRLFLPISIVPRFGWSVSRCWPGGHFCSQYGRLDGIPAACHSLSLNVFATANAQYPEPPVLQWIFISDTGFLLCALLHCLYTTVWSLILWFVKKSNIFFKFLLC
jgi:hypothetical protein